MANQRRPSSQIAPVDSASPANGIELRSFFLGREIASRHFEAGQKLHIAPLASSVLLSPMQNFFSYAPNCDQRLPSSFLASVSSFVQLAAPVPMPEPAVSSLQFRAIS